MNTTTQRSQQLRESVNLELDEKIRQQHRYDSLNILLYMMLLVSTVLTVWMFKHRRLRFLHETGLALIFGLVVGAIIRYTGGHSEITHIDVQAAAGNNSSALPPDTLWLVQNRNGENRTYSYWLAGEVTQGSANQFAQLATFDPEIFFNIILPPIIFNAGYSLKKRSFFRNIGSILCFAFVGTTISTLVIGGLMYMCGVMVTVLWPFDTTLSPFDCFYFGALISATDPVTILAIFSDLHVDTNLFSLVLGESVLNDAVALVLASAVETYAKLYEVGGGGGAGGDGFQAFLHVLLLFVYVLFVSLVLGVAVGSVTALVTKFTRLHEFALLESSLFLIMSYSSFLLAETLELSGIVTVLFCGIFQAHYTFKNLSMASRAHTKYFFELLNFLAENFIFSYIGVSLFTFPNHQWSYAFTAMAFAAVPLGRLLNIYPLSALLNVRRRPKIPANFQHMMFFSGLRGAVAFALAIRNTATVGRQTIYTMTSIIVAVTVLLGGCTTQLLLLLDIPVGETGQEETSALRDQAHAVQIYSGLNMQTAADALDTDDKSWLSRQWSALDNNYLKPLLTHCRPTLMDTLPRCCYPIAKLLTTTQQLDHGGLCHVSADHLHRHANSGAGLSDSDSAMSPVQPRPLTNSLQLVDEAASAESSRAGGGASHI